MARSARYTMLFFRTNSGRCEVKTFLRKMEAGCRDKCLSYLKRIRLEGVEHVPTNYAKKLADNLYEARPEWNNVEYRFLFGYVTADAYGVVMALKKNVQRLRPRDLNTAADRINKMAETMKESNI